MSGFLTLTSNIFFFICSDISFVCLYNIHVTETEVHIFIILKERERQTQQEEECVKKLKQMFPL